MKFKNKELMVIRGESIGSPEFTPQAEVIANVLLSAPHTAATPADTAGPAAHLEAWMPMWRSTDSLSLLGESGVLQVGVNDLGWVVYDWIPGP